MKDKDGRNFISGTLRMRLRLYLPLSQLNGKQLISILTPFDCTHRITIH